MSYNGGRTVINFIGIFILWADYYQSIKNNASSWGYFALTLTMVANFVSFVTGLLSLKAQVFLAEKARARTRFAADARANEMHTRPTDAGVVTTKV